MRTVKENKAAFILIVTFIIFSICYISNIDLRVQGDGSEYILQVISFQNHLSFGVTENDLRQAQNEFYNEAELLEYMYWSTPPMHQYGNARYSNHYGSYSALAMPIKLIVQKLGIYPLWAFPIINLILLSFAVLVIFFFLNTNKSKKFCLILLAIFNPVFFYIQWTHSEVYLYSFIIIGLVFYYNKQYARSILFLSIASMQNLGILPFAMMVGIDLIVGAMLDYVEEHGKFKFVGFIKEKSLKIISYGLCYIPGIIPLGSTYAKFHTINLVKDVAMENKYLLHKGLDYLFDLNMGIIPYETLVLILFFVLILIGFKRNLRASLINLIGIFGMLYIVSNQYQINCDMAGMMRYNIWIFPTMLFFVVIYFNEILKVSKEGTLIRISIIQAILTGVVIYYYAFGNGNFSYLEYAPWTKVVLKTVPQLYNPSHGIFYSRTLGEQLYYNNEPVMYKDYDGSIKKVILSREAEKVFYDPSWILVDSESEPIDKTRLNTILIDEGDFKYINITKNVGKAFHTDKYHLNDIIYFYTDKCNAYNYVQSGLSDQENWGTWTDGDKLVMLMLIDEDVQTISAHIDVIDVFYQPQRVEIFVNDKTVFDSIMQGAGSIDFGFEKPETDLIQVKILLPDSISPSKVLNSSDDRDLGIGLRTMIMSAE